MDVLGLVSLSYSPAKYKQEWDKARKSYWLEQRLSEDVNIDSVREELNEYVKSIIWGICRFRGLEAFDKGNFTRY